MKNYLTQFGWLEGKPPYLLKFAYYLYLRIESEKEVLITNKLAESALGLEKNTGKVLLCRMRRKGLVRRIDPPYGLDHVLTDKGVKFVEWVNDNNHIFKISLADIDTTWLADD